MHKNGTHQKIALSAVCTTDITYPHTSLFNKSIYVIEPDHLLQALFRGNVLVIVDGSFYLSKSHLILTA